MRYRQLILTLIGGLMMLSAPITQAGDSSRPVVPPAKGEQCVEPTDVMRRDHMEFIMHQRDKTMHQGIRTPKYSLKACINCHVTPDQKGELARIDSPKHFCQSCHSAVAVSIDCFQCHSDQPEPADYRHRLGQDKSAAVPLVMDDQALSRDEIVSITTEGADHE